MAEGCHGFGCVGYLNECSAASTCTAFLLCIFRHDGGTFDMAVFGVDVTSVVELGKDPNGHLSVTSVNCEAQIADVDLKFYGGARYRIKEEERNKK